MMKGWQDVFNTKDKNEVETELRESGQDFHWKGDDELSIMNKQEAIETHPETGDKIWFNHALVRERWGGGGGGGGGWGDRRVRGGRYYQYCMVYIHTTAIQVFHFSMMTSELYRVYKRVGGLQYWFFSWICWFLKCFFFAVRDPFKLGFHTFFGDGSEIPERYLEHIRDVVWRNLVFNRWEEGDIVMIDNFRISHGRQVIINCLTMTVVYM